MRNTLILVGIAALLLFMGCNQYNGMVTSLEDVKSTWAKVESQYQRRSDLIPNIVNTVKGAANFEQETLTKVIEARSKATQMKVDANDLSPEKMAEFEKAQGQLSGALSRLLVVTENYPQLQATQQFSELRAELAGTENRITVARNDFNSVVKSYNINIKRFPASIFASIFGFKERGYFQSNPGSENAPKVEF
jgi:LemA protein